MTATCFRALSCRRKQLDPKGAVVRIEVVEGYIDKVEWPPQLSRYRDFFTIYAAKITARAAGQYPHDRALSAPRGRSAGTEIFEQPEAVHAKPAPSILVVDVAEKPIAALGRKLTTAGRRRGVRSNTSAPRRSTICSGSTKR